MDILEELRRLIASLRESQLDYALCGGFALAAYGIVRATDDIDLMMEEAALAKFLRVVEPLGFYLQTPPLVLKDGQIRIHRFVKTESRGPDSLLLDVLAVTPATQQAWETKELLETDFGNVPVVSRNGLIQLKSLRSSGQDMDDIERLKQL